MIVVTGGEGFIGKNLINELKKQGYDDIVSLDIKSSPLDNIQRWLVEKGKRIKFIFHLGAITDTTEDDMFKLNKYNFSFSIFIWSICSLYKIPLIYASSAATYGDGKMGFNDEIDLNKLKPLNLYGESKHNFDKYVMSSTLTPPYWYGLKFFNVYGHGEEHKGAMASVMYHFYNQIKLSGKVKLFKSYKKDIEDGEQKRDFIYVDDVVNVCITLMNSRSKSGIYNLGTGNARSYNEVAKTIFKTLKVNENIEYVDMSDFIKDKYQYNTCSTQLKLKKEIGLYNFTSLEDGIYKYINKLENEINKH